MYHVYLSLHCRCSVSGWCVLHSVGLRLDATFSSTFFCTVRTRLALCRSVSCCKISGCVLYASCSHNLHSVLLHLADTFRILLFSIFLKDFALCGFVSCSRILMTNVLVWTLRYHIIYPRTSHNWILIMFDYQNLNFFLEISRYDHIMKDYRWQILYTEINLSWIFLFGQPTDRP